jgi:hypothetical protein
MTERKERMSKANGDNLCLICLREHPPNIECSDMRLTYVDCGAQIKPVDEWIAIERTDMLIDSRVGYRRKWARPLCQECCMKRTNTDYKEGEK